MEDYYLLSSLCLTKRIYTSIDVFRFFYQLNYVKTEKDRQILNVLQILRNL